MAQAALWSGFVNVSAGQTRYIRVVGGSAAIGWESGVRVLTDGSQAVEVSPSEDLALPVALGPGARLQWGPGGGQWEDVPANALVAFAPGGGGR